MSSGLISLLPSSVSDVTGFVSLCSQYVAAGVGIAAIAWMAGYVVYVIVSIFREEV